MSLHAITDRILVPFSSVRQAKWICRVLQAFFLYSVNYHIILLEDSGSFQRNNAIIVIQSFLWWITQHYCTATNVLPLSQALVYQSLSVEDIGSIDMIVVWEGMALEQGHKSCL